MCTQYLYTYNSTHAHKTLDIHIFELYQQLD